MLFVTFSVWWGARQQTGGCGTGAVAESLTLYLQSLGNRAVLGHAQGQATPHPTRPRLLIFPNSPPIGNQTFKYMSHSHSNHTEGDICLLAWKRGILPGVLLMREILTYRCKNPNENTGELVFLCVRSVF